MNPRRILQTAAAASCVALLGASPAPVLLPNSDPSVIAVTQYVHALTNGDYPRAYAMLTSAQQRYFGNERNFGSNAAAARYSITKFALDGAFARGQMVEVVVREDVTFYDIASRQLVKSSIREPFFSLREGGTWRVKQLYQPWKSYAPDASGRAQGVSVTVARIEFYDQRVKFDCVIRNDARSAVQVVPLGQTTLDDGAGTRIPAINEPNFPLNDVGFFEGFRLEPGQQAVGFINFPLARRDAPLNVTLAVAPAIHDGADKTFSIVVGPFALPKL